MRVLGCFRLSLSLKSASLVSHPITGAGICIESVHYNVLIAPESTVWAGEQGATSSRLIIIAITININTATDGLRTHNNIIHCQISNMLWSIEVPAFRSSRRWPSTPSRATASCRTGALPETATPKSHCPHREDHLHSRETLPGHRKKKTI